MYRNIYMLESRRIVLTTEYVYLRTKNVFTNESNEVELFVFAGLTRNTLSQNEIGRKKRVENIVSKVMEFTLADAPEKLVKMENVDHRLVIDETVFEQLKEQAEIDPLAFCTFEPSNR